jgi:hypothetical protein
MTDRIFLFVIIVVSVAILAESLLLFPVGCGLGDWRRRKITTRPYRAAADLLRHAHFRRRAKPRKGAKTLPPLIWADRREAKSHCAKWRSAILPI